MTHAVRASRYAAALAVSVVLLATASLHTTASADPPGNPSDAQITAAQQTQQAAAVELGSLQAQAVQLQARIDGLQDAADAKAAQYERTSRELATALDVATAAKTTLERSNRAVAAAREQSHESARAIYQNGSALGAAVTVLVAPDTDIDFSLAATEFLADRQARVADAVTVATVAAANADAERRRAVAEAERLQQQAAAEQTAALTALDTATATRTELTAQLDQVNVRAATAAATLGGLLDQRATYNAYLAELARQEATRREAARQAALRAAAAQAAAEAAARAAAGATDDDGPTGTAVGGQAPPPVTGGSWTRPLTDYRISSCYCARWGTFHRGLDMPAPLGTPIYAVGPGTVIRSGPASGFGNWVVIDHGDGTVSVYGHMRVLVAREGQRVGPGTLIAYVGNEGQSTGPHLHFEVRVGGPSGPSTDPTIWLRRRGVSI